MPRQLATVILLFVGLSSGTHTVRARSLDGLEHSPATTGTFPATMRLAPAGGFPR